MAYRSSTIHPGATTATPAYAVPAGAAADDIAVVGMFTQDAGAITPPAGFTLKYDSGIVNAYRHVIFWKRLTGADSGSYTFTMAGSSYCEGTCVLFSGRATTGDPFTATDSATDPSNTAITVTALTAAASDDLVGFAHQFNGGAWTPPSGMTERQDASASSTLDTADAVTAGSTGNMTFTCAGGASGMKAFLGALTALLAAAVGETHAPWLLRPPGRISPAGRSTAWLGTGDVASGTAFAVPATDPAGLADSLVIDRGLTSTDPAGLTDTLAYEQGKALTDSAGLTDSAALTLSLALTDATGLTDSATVENARLVTATDTTGLTDSVVLDRGTVITDSTGLTDTTTVALDLARTFTDTTGLTDSTTIDNGKAVTQNDTTGLTDSTVLDRGTVATDTTGLTDSASLALSRAVTDSTGLTDSTTIENAKTVTANDTAGLTDAVVLQLFKAITDTAGMADLAALTRGMVATDTTGLLDTVDVVHGSAQTLTITDTTGLTDTATIVLVPTITDALILTARNAPAAHNVTGAPPAHTVTTAPAAHTVRNT
ncbi:MAG: hypothetical protein ABIR39_12190 [Nocardioides sp.]|uniref:hypothetical protein n=1 Tax=Nocardioides sp. TaxID=35761 RepID=UPI0032669EA3